ncbi:MAG: hypothetical protein Q9220_000741 [cf. Caloplaca sp. 1 TL-2023]
MSRPNLATKLDPSTWGGSSVASSIAGKSAKDSTKTRAQLLSQVLGDPVSKGAIRDGTLTWTPPKAEMSTPPTSTPTTRYPPPAKAAVDNGKLKWAPSSAGDAAHNIKCKGCDVVFLKASALLAHFEKNQCRPADGEGVSSGRFDFQRVAMAMAMQTLEKEKGEESSKGTTGSNAAVGIGGSMANSSVGGVPIELSEQPDFLTDNEYRKHDVNLPPLSSHGTARPPSPAESEASTNLLSFEDNRTALNASNLAVFNRGNRADDQTTPKASVAEWPTAGRNDWPALGEAVNKDDLVQAMAKTKLQKPMMSPGISAPPSVQPSHTGFSIVDGSGHSAVELQPNTVSGMWECPYYKCG